MYPVLILRCEVVCLLILLSLVYTSRSYHIGRDSRTFYRLCSFAVMHVIFDIVTVWTVNHLDSVPGWLNNAAHIIFYLTAILFSHEILHYVVKLCYPGHANRIYVTGLVLPAIYLCCLPWLDIEYVTVSGTNSSTGPAAYVGYGIAFVYFVSAAIVILLNTKRLSAAIKRTLLPVLLVLTLTETVQCFYRELLFTGAAITIVTVAFFFTLENPVKIFERKVMTDALTGVRSRHSYDTDIAAFDVEFTKHPSDDFIFAFCDINNLRAINARFGHTEGDNYISFIASELKKSLLHADGIYRMGGDEFLVVFRGVPEETAAKELAAVHANAELDSVDMDYDPSVAIGYAVSTTEYSTLRDVLRTADYMMYRNKAEMKERKAFIKGIKGTRLNLTGLTDRLFDAMCTSNDRTYPFITNMETGVTRISDYWKEYFDLPDVFYSDFNSVWSDYIHPDDRKAFLDDINNTVSGRQQYHDCEYRAINPSGEYVKCSCHGSLYHGKDGEPDIFAGYMINHGVEETVDAVTGLDNFSVLSKSALESKMDHVPYSVLKLRIRNFSRINMLYGYDTGSDLRRLISESLCAIVGTDGKVFCQDNINFTIKVEGDDRDKVKNLYKRIVSAFSAGVFSGEVLMPLELAGGALIVNTFNDNEIIEDAKDRSSLIAAVEESDTFRHGKLVFVDELTGAGSADVELLADIHRDAIGEKKHFLLRYQPIVDTLTGGVCGAEALLRWNHPQQGEISPAKFISFLENDPCYFDLGFFILRTAITDSLRFRRLCPGFRISVNITALQLQRDDFLPKTLDILKELDFPASALVLELTERCKELDESFLKERIRAIRTAGIKIALDDIGTGYSSLSLLLNIPVDEMKLDKEFTKCLPESSEHRIVAEALTKGALDIGMDLCFEGIENEAQYRYVESQGAFLCQGYYFAKPLKKDELEEYIKK